MALSPEDLAAIAQMIAANQPEPAAATAAPAKATGTARKATFVRKMDPVVVEAGESVTFTVLAHSATGSPYSRGARVVGAVDGKVSRSLDLAMVSALGQPGILDQLKSAIAKVNKDAMLAEHAPKREEPAATA
jgi:hypothetical protein